MRLTRKQIKEITDIVDNKAEFEGYVREIARKSNKKSYVNEGLDDATSPGDIPENIASELEDDCLDISQEVVMMINKVLFASLARKLASLTGERMTSATLQDDLEDFGEDDMTNIQMELHADVVTILDKYINTMAEYAMHVKLEGSGY